MPVFDASCIDVEDYLDCLEIRNVSRSTETEFQFSCPYPAHVMGDRTPSAYMNTETTAFICYSCKAKGNAVSFAADMLKVTPIAAVRMLKQRYSPGGIDPDARNMTEEIRKIIHKSKPKRRENEILDESVLDAYHVDWPVQLYQNGHYADPWARYIFDRGFSIATLMQWQFGYSFAFGRITLPIRDEHGCLIGIKARALDDRKPKYLNLHDRKNGVNPFLKNDVVFALDRALKSPNYDGSLIIVEGELNAVAMHSLGYENTVAINGSYFGDRQIKLIKEHADRVVIFFDSDEAGFSATRDVAETLLPFLFVEVCPDHDGDPADMHPYSVRRCLAEARGFMEVLLARS